MSKIIGVTVGTPTSPAKMGEELKPVKTVNGISPDETGNVDVSGFRGDWNQNDPTAQDYVKNRPFYSEESWAVVHEEQTVHFMTDSYGIQGVWIHAAPHICDAYPVGTTCKVVIDGEEFVGVIDSQNNNRYFGNAHLYWHDLADTGESFCVASGGLDTLFIYTTKPVTMCKVSVLACDGETVKKLDAKYLPDVVAKQKPLTFTGAVEVTYDGSVPVEVVIPQGGSDNAWELIGECDLSSGALVYKWDNLSYSEVVIVNMTSLVCTGYITRINNTQITKWCTETGVATRATVLTGGALFCSVPRASSSTDKLAVNTVINTSNEKIENISIVFTAVTSGTILVYAR